MQVMKGVIKILLTFIFVFPVVLYAASKIPECSESKPAIMVSANNSTFIVRLKSNPTTGYSWFIRDNLSGLKPISSKFIASKKTSLVGSQGVELWKFKVQPTKVPRQFIMHFIYARPFEIGVSTGFVCQVSAFA